MYTGHGLHFFLLFSTLEKGEEGFLWGHAFRGFSCWIHDFGPKARMSMMACGGGGDQVEPSKAQPQWPLSFRYIPPQIAPMAGDKAFIIPASVRDIL